MRLARRASLLVALYALASAVTAYAECSWVFWQEATGPPTYESSTWTVSAWETRSACEQALVKKVRSDSAPRNGKGEVTVDDMAGKPRVMWRTPTKNGVLVTSYTLMALKTRSKLFSSSAENRLSRDRRRFSALSRKSFISGAPASADAPAPMMNTVRLTGLFPRSASLRVSGSLPALQKILGHADLKMTLRYAHLAPHFLRDEIAKTERPAQASAQEPTVETVTAEGAR